MTTRNLLVELFVEELPPKALKKLGEAFASQLLASLKSQGLTSDAAVATPFASPRRLAAHITQVAAQAADRVVQQKLMPVAVALDASGQATPALLKKLAALGADLLPVVPGLHLAARPPRPRQCRTPRRDGRPVGLPTAADGARQDGGRAVRSRRAR